MPNGTVRLTVRMVDVQAGSLLPPAQVDARPDSLQASIQQVMAQLLARRAGEPEQRLAALLNRPWPALVAYLSGQRAYRQARYAEAADDFEKALTIDPTFGLAAFGLRAETADEFCAVHRRHFEIGDDQVGRVVLEPGEKFRRVAEAMDHHARFNRSGELRKNLSICLSIVEDDYLYHASQIVLWPRANRCSTRQPTLRTRH